MFRINWIGCSRSNGIGVHDSPERATYTADVQTRNNTTNQTLYTLRDFYNNSVNDIKVTITGKRNGNHASYIKAILSASVGRNNAAAVELGHLTQSIDTWGSENALVGTVFDVIGGANGASVRVNNPPNYAINWSIDVNVTTRLSIA